MILSINKLNYLPQTPGIYKFYDKNNKLIYIGKAINLRRRVKSYFNDTNLTYLKVKLITSQICQIEVIKVASDFEALLLEAKLIKLYQPKYNAIWKDDKRYIYIQITKDEFPTIVISRKKSDDKSDFFGPFPSTNIIKKILSDVRKVIPYCTQKLHIKKVCFYSHLNLCNPCPASIKKMEKNNYKYNKLTYLRNIKNIKLILQGKINKYSRELNKKMMILSKYHKFEQAAIIRDKLLNLNYIRQNKYDSGLYLYNPDLIDDKSKDEQIELYNLISKYKNLTINKIEKLECYDISNISGMFATGSMVTFVAGQPYKELYRKFKIKNINKSDDFEMLKQIFLRRLSHHDWSLPDLFIVDGGKPQLIKLVKVFQSLNISRPLIGISKRNEELVLPVNSNYLKIILPINSPSLNLIKRIRDEAHRFAHQYHLDLRLKYLTLN